jgi:hypothetical protein
MLVAHHVDNLHSNQDQTGTGYGLKAEYRPHLLRGITVALFYAIIEVGALRNLDRL